MLDIVSAQKIIAKEFEKIKFPDTPADLYDPIRYILSAGGKKIRPVLVLLACDLFGKDSMKAIGPALGIEIFHNFTLLHDDLMDNSVIRRNTPTVHVKWNPNVAVLSGDAMSFLAYQFVSRAKQDVLTEVLELFNSTALKVCEGQMMDMNFENEMTIPLDIYFEMIGLKTSVLIAASLKMGSVIAGASAKDKELIYEFGYNLGVAFQLQDDLLDIYGNENSFGKRIGNDIVTNKKTFLLIKAFDIAKDVNLSRLKSLFSDTRINPDEKIQAVKKIFNDLNIRNITEEQISKYYQTASERLDLIDVEMSAKQALKDFSEILLKRDN